MKTAHEFRLAVRGGKFRGPTAGYCDSYVQANLAILPHENADDFARFCELNPKPCPLVAVGEPGRWALPGIALDLDIRTDVPGFFLYRDGQFAGRFDDLKDLWRDDFVIFAIGCSYSFEHLLMKEQIPLRHIEEKCNAPMYITDIPNQAAGPFGGNLVVSMRPMTPKDAIRAIEITSRYPKVHGAPVHFGTPSEIGITNLGRPDFGDAVTVREGEIPVFWACGVTPQTAMIAARLPIAIGHAPGHMLITDLPISSVLAQ